jgi:hypothetical protein
VDSAVKSSAPTVDYIGPFEKHAVVVNGWTVPLLEAHPLPGGKISLTLDQRFGLDLDLADAERIVPFLAHAIAIGLGYASHPDEGAELLPVPPLRPRRLLRLDWFKTEEVSEES